MAPTPANTHGLEIAIIGMVGRFPGAGDVQTFWRNLCDGVESITFFDDEQLIQAGVHAAALKDPNYVRAGGVLDQPDLFDAEFFGFNPREAELLDPQHRLFLEGAWQALEDAGYTADKYAGSIGVYAGVDSNNYLYHNLYSNRQLLASVGLFQASLSNDRDTFATRVSYKLNLNGPSLTLQTACSTSLVAVHVACQSLLAGECDMALAGGVCVTFPQISGYPYSEGMILSPDGHCRAFDAKAKGSINGRGMGIVVLKRLADALEDGDTLHAVIKGSAINNDGGHKIGYTAPAIDGQAKVIETAQMRAEVDPRSIHYIEAHGTGTELGDPIEIAALTQAFRKATADKNFCAIGSVKTNIGHLGAAAGVAGLIKAVLALKHKQIPPSLHYEKPNPKIDFAASPFFVNTELRPWESNGNPRRAGVSSFGIGGTNAHVVLEEAPPVESPKSSPPQPYQLITLSARTEAGLKQAGQNLAAHLIANPQQDLADVAYTLLAGRKVFRHRLALVCGDRQDAIDALEPLALDRVLAGQGEAIVASPMFLFSGQGAQYVNMGHGLYEHQRVFREQLDRCCQQLQPHLGLDLRRVIYPDPSNAEQAAKDLKQTRLAQPALFAIEYAMAQLWISWGVQPSAMLGHSIGQYVAACLAGVMSLDDALGLIATRAKLMQSVPAGTMLAVPMPESQLVPLLSEPLSLAAVNGPALCVVSGPEAAIDSFEHQLSSQGVIGRRLHTSHAFHSSMMDLIIEPFAQAVAKIKLSAPAIPYVCNVTGDWITAEQAVDPSHWAKHLRLPVRFSQGLSKLLGSASNSLLLELGPGHTLSTLAKQHLDPASKALVVSCVRHPQDKQHDVAHMLTCLGRIWVAGIELDCSKVLANPNRRRVPLPTYPFELQRFWVEPQTTSTPSASQQAIIFAKDSNVNHWLYAPAWKTSLTRGQRVKDPLRWLLFEGACDWSHTIAQQLAKSGHEVICVKPGDCFESQGDRRYELNVRQPQDYQALLDHLAAADQLPDRIVHLGAVTTCESKCLDAESFRSAQDNGLYPLLHLTQAWLKQAGGRPLHVHLVTRDTQAVTGDEPLVPQAATVHGAAKVIQQEQSHITCSAIDLSRLSQDRSNAKWQLQQLTEELLSESPEPLVAYRGRARWVKTFESIGTGAASEPIIRQQGVYLITGGLGGVGLALASYLAQTFKARLVLTGRTALPVRDQWSRWLEMHDDQNATNKKILGIQAMEAAGAQVMIEQADVCDPSQMRRVVENSVQRFGPIEGVIHAAGVVSGSSMREVATLDPADFETQFQPKVYGLMVLDQALADQPLAFFVLTSSLASILGGLKFAAYAAANQFMDGYAQLRCQAGDTHWLSINWDGWLLQSDPQPAANQGGLTALAMTTREAVAAFAKAMALPWPGQVAISTADLNARISRWVRLTPARSRDAKQPSTSRYARPNLQNAFVAPETSTEKTVAAIWQELLGVDRVGIHDNFFELGGHSLLATQMIARMKTTFQAPITIASLFEHPTVHTLSRMIDGNDQVKPGPAKGMARGEKRKAAALAAANRRTGNG